MQQPIPLRYEIAGHRWKDKRSFSVMVQRPGDRGYSWRAPSKLVEQELEADFVVTIDIPALIDLAVQRCRHTKGGRATVVGGLIKAKRSELKVLSNTETPVALPEGVELVTR